MVDIQGRESDTVESDEKAPRRWLPYTILTAAASIIVVVAVALFDGTEESSPIDLVDTAVDTDSVPTAALSVSKDVVYATSLPEDDQAAGEPWELDIYAPTDDADLPVIVLLHGFTATKDTFVESSERIAESGAVVYAINAPVESTTVMSFDHGRGFREISEILTCAIGYARSSAADFGGDSDRVVLVAHSWGALYGAWFALGSDSLAANWQEYAADHGNPPPQVDCVVDPSSAHVEGFVGIGGAGYSDVERNQLQDVYPDLVQIISPYSQFGQSPSLPIRLLVGDREQAVVLESSRAFNEALVEAGYESELILFDGPHSVPPEETFEAVIQLTGS